MNRHPKDITVADIMEVLEGPIEISSCLEGEDSCGNVDCCATRLLWAKIKKSLDNIMESTTLQDMVEDYRKINPPIKRSENNE